MRKLRLGVIGAGAWATASHLPNFAKRGDEVEFVAVSRKGDELLKAVRETWGFEVASEDYRDVLEAGVDICLVASPHALHYEHASAALEAGAHVLCEKPMTLMHQDAWDLVRLAQDRERHLVVAYGWNYFNLTREAKRLMDQHGVGQIEETIVQMASPTRDVLTTDARYVPDGDGSFSPDNGTWTDPANGGGYGQAQLTHALGLALWLTNQRADSAFAVSHGQQGQVELHQTAVLRFVDGAIGSVSGAAVHPTRRNAAGEMSVRVTGNDGQLVLSLERGYLSYWHRSGVAIERGDGPKPIAYNCVGPPNALVDLALGYEHAENCSPGEIGARTVEILEAMYDSASSGQLVAIPH
jgi:predicted dehydrogenase